MIIVIKGFMANWFSVVHCEKIQCGHFAADKGKTNYKNIISGEVAYLQLQCKQ